MTNPSPMDLNKLLQTLEWMGEYIEHGPLHYHFSGSAKVLYNKLVEVTQKLRVSLRESAPFTTGGYQPAPQPGFDPDLPPATGTGLRQLIAPAIGNIEPPDGKNFLPCVRCAATLHIINNADKPCPVCGKKNWKQTGCTFALRTGMGTLNYPADVDLTELANALRAIANDLPVMEAFAKELEAKNPQPGPACPYAGRRYLAIGEILRDGDMYPSASSFTGLDPTVQIGFAVDKANWYVRMVEAPKGEPFPAPAGDPILRLKQSELDSLLEYSTSVPTGTTIGKRWKRKTDSGWLIGEYVPDQDPKRVGIKWYQVEITDAPMSPALVPAPSACPAEDFEVLGLCEKHGFGAVMSSASRQWIARDPVGALTVGPTIHEVQNPEKYTPRAEAASARRSMKLRTIYAESSGKFDSVFIDSYPIGGGIWQGPREIAKEIDYRIKAFEGGALGMGNKP